MTYTIAAGAQRGAKRLTHLAFTALAAIALAGCETGGGGLFSGNASTPAPQAQIASPAPTQMRAKVAIATPLQGVPEAVAASFVGQMTDGLRAQRIAVAQAPGEAVDYTLKGYMVASREGAGARLSYLWDILDRSGQRANRVSGEEVIAKADSRDIWASVSPAVVSKISQSVVGSVASWMPNNAAPGAAPPVAGATPQPNVPVAQAPAVSSAPSAPNQPVAPRPVSAPASPVQAAPAIASQPAIPSRSPTAQIIGVSGAPGDGNIALASAIRQELERNAIQLAPSAGPNTYRVEGRVALGKPDAAGKQAIQIDWRVRDPRGGLKGTVTQKNEVPKGSLDGKWGETANLAAAAAAQGIVKLIDPSKVAANTRTN